MSTPPKIAEQLPMKIETKDVALLFYALGHEMQGVPKIYRDKIFKALERRKVFFGKEPTIQSYAMDVFMAGWMNYP